MMFTKKLATFIGALVFAGATFAAQQASCPNLEDIQSEGLSMTEEMFPGFYLSFHMSDYGSDSIWAFAIAPIQADNEDGALETGNKILSNMTEQGVPVVDDDGLAVCLYGTGVDNVLAVAANAENMISPMKFNKFFKKKH